MAISIPSQTSVLTHWIDAQTQLTMTSGNWLVAIVTWRYLKSGPAINQPVVNIADASRNVWTLLATKIVQANNQVLFPANMTTGTMACQVWACPQATFNGWPWNYVTASLQAFLGIDQSSVVIQYVEVAGMGNGFLTVDSVTPWVAYNSTSITMTAPDPAGANDCMMVAAAAADINYGSYTVTGTGWTALNNSTAGSDTPELGLFGAWRDATTGGSVTFSLVAGFFRNWVGVLVSFRTTGIVPAQSNPNWPAVECLFGFGYNLSVPPSYVWFSDQSRHYWAVNTKRGIQYELGNAQAEPTTITLRNDDGTFSPRNTNNPPVITCVSTGTTTSFNCTDAAASALSVTDLFKINYTPINSNTDFSGGTSGWTGTGGTFTVTSSIGQIVPSGVAATVMVESAHVAVTPGGYYDINGLLQNNVARSCTVRVNWYDSGASLISSPGVTIPLQANTLGTYHGTFVAPSNAATGAVAGVMTGTPPATNVMFLDNLTLAPTDEVTNFKVRALSSTAATLNSNPSFETNTAGWSTTGATLTRSTTRSHSGVASGLITVVSGTNPRIETSPHSPVTPGSSYRVTGWLYLPAAVPTSVSVSINWFDSGNVYLSTSSNTNTTPRIGSWFLMDATFVAPVGAAFADVPVSIDGTPTAGIQLYCDDVYLIAIGTTTVTYSVTGDPTSGSLFPTKAGDVVTFTPIDMYLPYRIYMSWNGKREYLTSGWIERWPQTWRDPYWGTVGALGISALSTITAANPTALGGEISRRNPWAYWPLSDAAGSTTATNVAGRSTFPLTVTTMKAGAGSGLSDFGAPTQGTPNNPSGVPSAPNITFLTTLGGDPGTGWHSVPDWQPPYGTTGPYAGNGVTDLNNGKGTALVASNATFPSITTGVTVMFCSTTSIDQSSARSFSTIDPTVFILRNANPSAGVGQGSVIKVSISNSGGSFKVTVWDKNTHAATATNLSGVNSGPTWNACMLSFTQTSWSFYWGGALQGSGSCNLVDTFTGIDVAGEADQFFSGHMFPCTIAHVAVFDQLISSSDAFQLTVAAQLGYNGETEVTTDRIQRKLDTIGMKTGRIMDNTGQTWLDAEGQDASTVADLANQIGAYEDAYVFEDAAGVYQYRPPGRYAYQAPRAILGENTNAGEIPYLSGIEADFDPTYLYNNITVTNSIFSNAAFNNTMQTTTFSIQDDGSASKYNLRTYGRSTRLAAQDQQEVFYLAYWLLAQYSTGTQRFQTVTLDPASNPAIWRFCLTVEVCDVIVVVRRPLGAPTISSTCVVMQVQHDSSSGSFKTTLTLAPARSGGLITNDPVQGIAGTNYLTME